MEVAWNPFYHVEISIKSLRLKETVIIVEKQSGNTSLSLLKEGMSFFVFIFSCF